MRARIEGTEDMDREPSMRTTSDKHLRTSDYIDVLFKIIPLCIHSNIY